MNQGLITFNESHIFGDQTVLHYLHNGKDFQISVDILKQPLG